MSNSEHPNGAMNKVSQSESREIRALLSESVLRRPSSVELGWKNFSKSRAALTPGGRCLTLGFVPNDDRVSPPMAAGFAMMILGTTAAGDAYTFSEYETIVP